MSLKGILAVSATVALLGGGVNCAYQGINEVRDARNALDSIEKDEGFSPEAKKAIEYLDRAHSKKATGGILLLYSNLLLGYGIGAQSHYKRKGDIK